MMDCFHRFLPRIKIPCLWNCNLVRKVRLDILIDDPICGRKKRQHMLDKVLLIFAESCVEIMLVPSQVSLFCGPQLGLLCLGELPKVRVSDGKQGESSVSTPAYWLYRGIRPF